MNLRNHVGYFIMNYKQQKAVRSYDGVIGEKSELFGGTGIGKYMEALPRSRDVNDYIMKMASKKRNWSESRVPGAVPDLSNDDGMFSVLHVYLSLGSKQEEDEQVITFFDPADKDSMVFVGLSQNELDLPCDQFDKKNAAQQTHLSIFRNYDSPHEN